MALYDNKHYLLSHIRNSFITSDDSGMCEVVMTCDNLARQVPVGKYDCYPNVLEEEEEDAILAHSFDLSSDLQFGLRRPKGRMERTSSVAEKKKAPKMKNIKWSLPARPLTSEELDVFFPMYDIETVRRENLGKRVSLLTELLTKYPNLPENPFKDYAKLDGNAQVGVPIKKYRIYVTMLPEEIQKFPMEVSIVSSAKVSDLIGLICWKCSTEFSDVTLKDDVDAYRLFIAEDDGDVDWDFPCLDSREVINKFGFSHLAVVDRESASHVPEESYPLVIETKPRHPVEPTSARAQLQREEDIKKFRGQMNALEAPLYQSFSVHIVNKFRVKTEIYLEISGEKLEIVPVIQPHFSSARMLSVKLWGRQRVETYSMDDVVACELTEHKSNGRSIFMLVHWKVKRDRNECETGKFKTKDFESETSVAVEIVNKVNHILECRHSSRRQEYITLRERKSHRRKAFLSPR
ncbi:Stress-activated map kinase-interacting protein [Nesidiocoris tenuis]|uniref:Stress-activated map kinase-interacting protein n=1 Tax=Nesidiocoris tenuis TaxID=355587 RepID=A0ABN7AL73_9HEMI|nr:Stress-activated map kinase-interacting protein [Nesidiocoris tenuis]